MKILSIECSATPCSVALSDGENIIASLRTLEKITHSQTLMPMVEKVLGDANVTFDDVDGFAVASGPGSFTGVRIGISAVKGMAAARKIPCASVSTLLAMAQLQKGEDCLVCPVMDARCNQLYNALFDVSKGVVTRLCDDRAILCEELAGEISHISKNTTKPIIIMGDGAELFFEYVKDIDNVALAQNDRLFQDAVGVALAADEIFKNDKAISPNKLLPSYLRLPQAERELKLKKEKKI